MLGWFKRKIQKFKEEPKPVREEEPLPPKEEAIPAEINGCEVAAPSEEELAAIEGFALPPVDEIHQEEPAEELTEEIEVTEAAPEHVAPAIMEEPQGKAEEEKGLFRRLASRLAKTRDSFIKKVDRIFLGKKEIDAELLDELEEILITADLGVGTVQDLLENVREQVKRKELRDPLALRRVIKEKILEFLISVDKSTELALPETGPFIIMVLGVNGVGKTTTIGKLANKFVRAGNKVLLVAADTFRAAAVEQLKIWGERIGVDVVSQKQGADPSSVIYDAIDYARPRNFDVIIVDTAGRLHTKVNLMEELKKIKRVMNKKHPGAPHEVLLVLDATTGQNAVSQAKLFNEAVNVTGIALTKLDGTAKGGIIINICHTLNIPIRFIGIGEKLEDLRDFDPNEFIEALFTESVQEKGETNRK